MSIIHSVSVDRGNAHGSLWCGRSIAGYARNSTMSGEEGYALAKCLRHATLSQSLHAPGDGVFCRQHPMDPYMFSLALGTTGLVVMALGGLGHHVGHVSPAHHTGHTGPPGGHGHHDVALPGHGHGHSPQSHDGAHASPGGKLWALLSPRVMCSFLVGVGASGLLLERWLFEPLVAAGALAGGGLF